MNYYFLLLFLFSLCFSCSSPAENRALFVGISDHPVKSKWTEIHGDNDALLIIPVLKDCGYKDENIIVLLNEQATKFSIAKAFEQLISKSHPGDYVYIHLSGHGQQMWDESGDEDDGWDESFIPYDALKEYKAGIYEGENHLRDDDLEIYLDRIRKKITSEGNLIVVLDACFSGTGTREGDDEYIRGTNRFFAPPGWENPPIDPNKLKLCHNQGKHLADITVFAACQPDQSNREYYNIKDEKVKRKNKVDNKRYGSLTFAMCELLKDDKLSVSGIKMAELIKEQYLQMFRGKFEQTPYFESTNEKKIFKVGR